MVIRKVGNTQTTDTYTAPPKVILVSTLVYIIGRSFPRPYSGNETAVLLHVIGYVHRVECDGCVKITEEEYKTHVKQIIEPVARRQSRLDLVHVGYVNELGDGCWEHDDGRRENRRNNPGSIDLQGKVGALPAHNPPADHIVWRIAPVSGVARARRRRWRPPPEP